MQIRNIALLGDFVLMYAMFGIFNKSISTVRINCKNNNNKTFSKIILHKIILVNLQSFIHLDRKFWKRYIKLR